MDPDFLLALAVVVVAGLMRGFAGVGSGMLMAPFFMHLFGAHDTVVIIVVLELIVTAQLLPGVFRRIAWRVIAPMGAAAMVMMPVGNHLLHTLDSELLRRGVGFLVTMFSLVLMTGWRYTGSKPIPVTLGVGGLSGALLALTSLGNPPVMLYLLSSTDSAATNRANFTGYFAVTLSALVAGMLFTGQIGSAPIGKVAVVAPVFMIFVWIGSRLFRQSNEAAYRRVAFALLLFAGFYGLLA
ncbi:MAG: sulfite exporter TauE/SafE family protein [Proteobacteria bacterium]|nr:MAG: sulfite exporter TauE/SafE family protein [Pseudomonadota bacterium]